MVRYAGFITMLALIAPSACDLSGQNLGSNRDRMACLVVAKTVLKCQSTQQANADDVKFARTAQVGDKWFPVGDGPITATLEADSIQFVKAGVYYLRGNVDIRTTKLALISDEVTYSFAGIETSGRTSIQTTP